MWTDNTRNANIKGDQIEMFKIYGMVMQILILIFFLKIKEMKITRGPKQRNNNRQVKYLVKAG